MNIESPTTSFPALSGAPTERKLWETPEMQCLTIAEATAGKGMDFVDGQTTQSTS